MSLTPGSRIGPYEIVVPVGAGAMGEVYRARDTRLARMVAIKVLTATDPQRIARLEREARAISRVSHPHICALHDIGCEDGLPYLVMEYLEGETLARRLEAGAVRLDQALSLAIEICDALDAAHTAGVIHRDLKPGNVMLTSSGVKLLDFGLAKLRDVEPDPNVPESTQSRLLTEDGAVLGTYPYMAPEQVAGGHVDGRADIFALGVVIYEMVSGTRPFDSPTRAGVAAAILTREPAGLSAVCGAVPPGLDRTVEKCLAKDPEARWQTARDLASELRWIAKDAKGPRRDESTATHDSRRRRRRLVRGGIATAAVLLASAIVIGGLIARGGVIGHTPIPSFKQVTFRSGTISSARFAPDGETFIYSATWQGQPYELFMSRSGSAESRPLGIKGAKLLGVSGSGELALLRGGQGTLNFFGRAGGTLARVSLAGGGPRDILDRVISADWIPGTDQLAVARTDGQIEFPIGTKIYKTSASAILAVRVAPGGDRLAVTQAGPPGPDSVSVIVLDRAGKTIASSRWTDSGSLAWSPNGREVWFSATHQYASAAMWAMSMRGETRVLLATDPEMHIIQDVFRDGRILLATHMRRVGFCCLRPGDTAPRELAWFDFSMPEALSADGSTVVFADRPVGAPGTAYLRKTDGSDAIRLGVGFPEDLSPDGSSVLVALREGTARLTIQPTGSGSSRSLPPGPVERIGEANFLPDGRQVAFAGGARGRPARIYVQRLDDESEPRAISPEGVGTNALATPDGLFVWGASPASGHALYPVGAGSPRPLSFLTAADEPLQWSPDGRYLYVRRRDSWPPAVDRIDTATGQRAVWRTVFPADPVGVDSIVRILITPDGNSSCFDYARLLTNLFVIDGVR